MKHKNCALRNIEQMCIRLFLSSGRHKELLSFLNMPVQKSSGEFLGSAGLL